MSPKASPLFSSAHFLDFFTEDECDEDTIGEYFENTCELARDDHGDK